MNRSLIRKEIASLIYSLRNKRVMLDSDLAELYGVETKQLNRAVKRNLDRFPEDFMFILSDQEVTNLRCQIGTSSSSYGGRRYKPYVFTEQGVAMLSSVLQSKEAANINIQIIRAFVAMREALSTHVDLSRKLEQLEYRLGNHDEEILAVDTRTHHIVPADPPREECHAFVLRAGAVDRMYAHADKVAGFDQLREHTVAVERRTGAVVGNRAVVVHKADHA